MTSASRYESLTAKPTVSPITAAAPLVVGSGTAAPPQPPPARQAPATGAGETTRMAGLVLRRSASALASALPFVLEPATTHPLPSRHASPQAVSGSRMGSLNMRPTSAAVRTPDSLVDEMIEFATEHPYSPPNTAHQHGLSGANALFATTAQPTGRTFSQAKLAQMGFASTAGFWPGPATLRPTPQTGNTGE